MSSFELLSAGEVHLYVVNTADAKNIRAMADCEPLLSADEKERRTLFHFERDRRQYTLTRALLRRLLSIYRPQLKPMEWTFDQNSFGKPFIRGEPSTGLQFNLSHTRDMIVFAFAADRLIGVDVEWCSREINVMELAEQVFAKTEITLLQNTPGIRQRDLFFRMWTLKEAYVKCLGMGLSIPLNSFTAFGPEVKSAEEKFATVKFDRLGLSYIYCPICREGYALSLVVNGNQPCLRKFVTRVGSKCSELSTVAELCSEKIR